MLAYFRDKITNLIVTLRFSLLTIFITLFVVTMFTLFSVFYFHLSGLVVRAAFLLVDKDTHAIINDLNIHLYPLEGASKFSAELIEDKVLDIKNTDATVDYINHLLNKLPLVNGVHWSDVNGNFIYSFKAEDGTITTEIIKSKKNPDEEVYLYRNKNGTVIKTEVKQQDFDARERPWYKLAMQRKKTVWSDVYVYSVGPQHLGVTISTPVYGSGKVPLGVFGMDVRLDYLSRYVATHKIASNGEVFIVDEHGKLIASPQLTQIDPNTYYKKGLIDLRDMSETYSDAFAAFQRDKKPMFLFKTDKQQYIASFKQIPSLTDHGWYIGIVDPESDFTKPMQQLQIIYLLIDLAIFVLGIALISNLVTRVVTPIKKLVKETEEIKNFNLGPGVRIVSRIKEVIDLSNALHAMKIGLRSFQKYVPASLVRQLISIDEDVRIGGTKRDLAILFSDIRDFTTITEKAESNQLVQQVCDYFDALTHIIIEDKGTIDKYIGDSIMAFWGAPLAVQDPCEHAARATLRCKRLLQTLNPTWRGEGKPELFTRFGIHFGEALVGNIGSVERLNYTVLGDAVNIASRLVNANKLYGTSILVSESVYKQLSGLFELRLIDHVILKGKAESIAIYELIAEDRQSILFDIDAYRATFSDGFSAYQNQQWREAMEQFAACIRIYAEDTVAPLFVERCKRFISSPPTGRWDGVWRFSDK